MRTIGVVCLLIAVLLTPGAVCWKGRADGGVPVFVMLPLDTIGNDGKMTNPDQLRNWLDQCANVGVDGVVVDVWWGVVERDGSQSYDWDGYLQLLSIVHDAGLRASCIMSFHQCGGNVGDKCNVPIPSWVLSVGKSNPDIFYTDQDGHRDQEYLSLGVDNETIFDGRSPVQMYSDFVKEFYSTFEKYMYNTVVEIQIGLGPAGELRFPAYQLSGGIWSFCGLGAFQCYDKYLLSKLEKAASAAGHPEWGNGGPDDAGSYDSHPDDTGFFKEGTTDNYASDYGQFFLKWYSGQLVEHADLVLSAVRSVVPADFDVAGKIAGIHWWYFHPSHAAELTVGYKNDVGNGYQPLADVFEKHNATFDFTCFEMKDSEQSSACDCGPQELVSQTAEAAHRANILYAAENALPRYDTTAYDTILSAVKSHGRVSLFGYLRLCEDLLSGSNWSTFCNFVEQMHEI